MAESNSPSTEPTILTKPREVSLAVVLSLAVVAAGLIQATTAFLERRGLEAGLIEAGKIMSIEQAMYRTRELRGSLPLAITLGVGAVVLFLSMSFFLSQGKRWARAATWVGGVALVIGEVILMASDSSAVKTGKFVTELDVPGGDPATVARLNDVLVPGWFPPLHYVSELLVLVGVIAVCVQLLRPGAADYFRRESEGRKTKADDRVWSTDVTRRS